jgi:tetratricopeptide (TPR) repeat protein
MKDAHLTPDELIRFLEDGGEEIQNRIFLHHLALCPECYAVGGYILDAYLAGDVGLDLCSIDIDLARTRREAPVLWEELAPLPFDAQRALVLGEQRFQTWGLTEFLCKKSEEEAARDPKAAVGLADLAVHISMALKDWCPTEESWLGELRGYAFAHLANARRAQGDLRGAEAASQAADEWGGGGGGPPPHAGDVLNYEARFLALKASLMRALRQFKDALRLLNEALDAKPTPALRVRIVLNQAKTYEELGDIDEAIRLLGEARAMPIDAADSRVRLCLAQNFLDYFTKKDRFLEAECALPEARAVVAELGSAIDRMHLRWTEARIAEGLGRTDEAIRLYEQVKDECAGQGLGYDAALVSLELGLLYAAVGRTAEMKSLAVEALAFFEAQNVHREALGAIALFRRAVDAEQVTSELLGQIIACLRRARSGEDF